MEIPRHWRLKAQRYRLEGSRCPSCDQRLFPPRPVCATRHCTTQLAQIAGGAFEVIMTSTKLTDLESRIRYEITERTIR